MACTLLRNLERSLYTCPSDEVVEVGSQVVEVGSQVVEVGSRWAEVGATRAVVLVAVGLGVTRLD